jgi:hypothetical protein
MYVYLIRGKPLFQTFFQHPTPQFSHCFHGQMSSSQAQRGEALAGPLPAELGRLPRAAGLASGGDATRPMGWNTGYQLIYNFKKY